MKQTIMTFALAAALAMASTTASAQSRNHVSPETMIEQQANRIAQQMNLDAKTTKKFVSVYKSEQSAMRELMPQRSGRPQGGGRPEGMPPRGERPEGNPPAMNGSDAKAPARPQMSEENRQKMDKLKAKYEKKYAKFFTQEQISQMRKYGEQNRANRRPQSKQQDTAK